MGCCSSRPSDDNTPAVRAHSSSHNITAPSTRPSSIPSLRGSQASQGNVQAPRSRLDANDLPNSPLKPIPAAQRSRLPNTLASPTARHVKPLTDSTSLTWTRSRLEKERKDWWDTQVTGSQEIWGAVRLAAQYLQAGELQEAQTMLDVTGCTCPTGLLWKGVYDPTGVQYRVPEWVVVEPDGLAEEEDAQGEAAISPASAHAPIDGAQEPEEDDKDDAQLVRARTSHNQRDVLISVRRKETVASIIEKLKKQAELDLYSRIRLAYSGRLYHDHETLESNPHWNYANNFVLSALVSL
ncbi:Nn.00g018360.m01.CDS01 [Neocucurbitaria sp. VM-36]